MRILLSFLGAGEYKEVDYRLDGQVYTSRYTQEALAQRYRGEGYALWVLLTSKAKEKHGEALRARVPYREIPIPEGRDEVELWDIFQTLAEAIPQGAQLVVDVSHGFRSQPILVLAALQFLQVAKGVQVDRVLYGMVSDDQPPGQERRDGRFVELTPFLELMEWVYAARDVLRFGQGQALADLLGRIHRQSYLIPDSAKARRLKPLGERVAALGEALNLLRPQQAFGEAKALVRDLERVVEDVERLPRSRPLAYLLRQIEDRYRPLALEEEQVWSPEGYGAWLQLIGLLLERGQYTQALALMREFVVSHATRGLGLDPASRDHRELGERELGLYASELQKGAEGNVPEEKRALAWLWWDLADLRNDVMHAGMRENPRRTTTVKEQAESLFQNLKALLGRGEGSPPGK